MKNSEETNVEEDPGYILQLIEELERNVPDIKNKELTTAWRNTINNYYKKYNSLVGFNAFKEI